MRAQNDVPAWVLHVNNYMNAILPGLVDTVHSRIQAMDDLMPGQDEVHQPA